MLLEIIKFIIYSLLIVIISKSILVKTLRKLAENLKLKPRTIGSIAGYATSMPELLTVGISSFNGLMGASVINVLSSNIINFLQYIGAVILNKNLKVLKNKAIKMDMILVIVTILIPVILVILKIDINMELVLIFFVLYLLFRVLDKKVHKTYLEEENKQLSKKIEKEIKRENINSDKKIVKDILILLITGILLFFIGDLLGNTLENLCNEFKAPQFIIGTLLGFITSIPELITFFESQGHYKKNESENIWGVVEATNNLITSNMLNLFIIQSVGIIIYML